MNTNSPKPIKIAPRSSAKDDLVRIEAAGVAWWATAPSVMMICLSVATAPFRALAIAADAAVSLIFLGVFGAVALWYAGYIPDETVAQALGHVGTRLLAIAEATGII